MPDYISRQIDKRMALDRWENEGGRIIADLTGMFNSGLSNESAGKENAAQMFDNPTAARFKVSKNKGDNI